MPKAGRDVLTVAPAVPASRRTSFAALVGALRRLASGEWLEGAFWRLDRVLAAAAPWLIAGVLTYLAAHVLVAVRGGF